MTHLGNQNELSSFSRTSRGVLGIALIAYTMLVGTTPLGWIAVLPLLAIYPVFTAITGLHPIKTFFTQEYLVSHALHLSYKARTALAVAGVSAISSVFFVTGVVGNMALLPLVGIYPVFAAIIGQDPVTALFNMDHTVEEEAEQSADSLRVVSTEQVTSHDQDHFHKAA